MDQFGVTGPRQCPEQATHGRHCDRVVQRRPAAARQLHPGSRVGAKAVERRRQCLDPQPRQVSGEDVDDPRADAYLTPQLPGYGVVAAGRFEHQARLAGRSRQGRQGCPDIVWAGRCRQHQPQPNEGRAHRVPFVSDGRSAARAACSWASFSAWASARATTVPAIFCKSGVLRSSARCGGVDRVRGAAPLAADMTSYSWT